MPDKNLIIEIQANTKQALKEINELKGMINEFTASVEKDNLQLEAQTNLLDGISKKIKEIAIAYAGFETVKSMLTTFAEYNQMMADVQAITGATKEQFLKLDETAQQLGKTTVFTAAQVAEGMKYLAMAGYKTKDIVASIGSVLKLAQIGHIDLGQAADIASNILTEFNLKASQTAQVVDVMTAAITNANLDIPELGEAMKYAGGVAHNLGVSIDQTATALAILANNGLKGTIAGTGLADILTRLTAPVGKAKKWLNQLGIEVYNTQGKFVGLENVLMQFYEKLKLLPEAERYKALKAIFGEVALKSVIPLINSMGGAYQKMFLKISKSAGEANKVVKIMNKTLMADWKRLESALQALAITIGKDLLPALHDFLTALTKVITETDSFYKEHEALIHSLLTFVSVLYAYRKIATIFEEIFASDMIMRMVEFATKLRDIRSAVLLLKEALFALKLADPVILALGAALAAVEYETTKLEEGAKRLNNATQSLTQSTKKFNSLMTQVSRHLKKFGGREEIVATAKEIDKLKAKTLELIKANVKRIETLQKLKKESGGYWSVDYEREINALVQKDKILEKLYGKLAQAKPYKNANEEAKNGVKEIQKLTQADKSYLNELQKRLQKQQRVHETLMQQMQEEINQAKKQLGNTKYFEEAKNEIILYYMRKRVNEHQSTINKLERQEQNLAKKIEEIQKNLQNRLKELENERIIAINNINEEIQRLQEQGEDKYQAYLEKQSEAQKDFFEAKKYLQKNNFELARYYMQQYRNLSESLANQEIKENGQVVVSREQANQIAVTNLKKLEGLTNEYYKRQKEEARKLALQKMQELKAQLEATKAQLKLEIERLNLEKKLIQALTGKKVTIDTSSALKAIKNLDNEINNLNEKIRRQQNKKIDLNADVNTKTAKNKVNNLKKETEKQKVIIPIDGDIKGAVSKLEIIDKKTGKKEVISFVAETKSVIDKLNSIKLTADTMRPVVKVNSDISAALAALSSIPRTIVTYHYIKTIEERAAGGLVAKYASGGIIDFEEFRKRNGKIFGHDPFDRDDVPALLTRGEFVIKRDAVDYYGDRLLWALNFKQVPKSILPAFATGGLVQKADLSGFDFNDLSISNDSEDSGDVLKSLTEAINSLKKYLYKLKGTPLASEIQNGIKKAINLKNEYSNDESELQNTQNEIKGKILKPEEAIEYDEKIKALQNNIKNVVKKINDFINNTVNAIKQSVENYLNHVSYLKEKIKSKIREFDLNADDFLTWRFQNTYNINELESYLYKLNSINPITKEGIDRKWSEYVNDALGTIVNDEIKWGFNAALMTRVDSMYPHFSDFAYQFYHLRENIQYPTQDYSAWSFGFNYSLPEWIIDKLIKDYYKNKLPKFQAGGLIKLQEGGKLSGYGGGDRNLALLEDGEFVIRKEAVRVFGVDLFEKLNNLTLPKFQTGGYVGNLQSVNFTTSKHEMKINFNMPSGKNYELYTSEEIALKLAEELKRIGV